MKASLQFVLMILCLFASLSVFAQDRTVHGQILAKSDSSAIPGAFVKVKGTTRSTLTDQDGKFTITAPQGASLIISLVGFQTQTADIGDQTEIKIYLANSTEELVEVPVSYVANPGGSYSKNSYWIGASIGYNVNSSGGNTGNNVVGGASVSINPLSNKLLKAEWAIVGNIGNFNSTQTASDITKNVSKLSQTNNGLSIGISAVWTLIKNPKETDLVPRIFFTSSYQLNTFQNAAPDTTSTSLSQWKNTIGLEFEGLKFTNEGKVHFGLAGTLGIFDGPSFQKVFMNNKSNILSLDASIILPLSKQFGFLFEGTYTQYTTPVYLIGIVIRSASN